MKNIAVSTTAMSPRVTYLDALRGVAIVMVILFHEYFTWPMLVPPDVILTHIIKFKIGNAGVELFFLISGFVIFMSLEQSKNIKDFLWKRWLRLFPAMLIMSMVIFVSSPMFPERLAGLPTARNLLAGISFVQPEIWHVVFGGNWHALEMPFWTLFIEVKFYIVVGIVYFTISPKIALRATLGLSIAANSIYLIARLNSEFEQSNVYALAENSGFQYFCWFAAGAFFYRATFEIKKANEVFLQALMVSVLSAIMLGWSEPDLMLPGILVSLGFAYVNLSEAAQRLICNRFFLFMGFISYPLYLLHENMTFALVVKIRRYMPQVPALVVPIIAISCIIPFVWLVTQYAEPILRKDLIRLREWLFALSANRSKPDMSLNAALSAPAASNHQRPLAQRPNPPETTAPA